MGSPAAEKGHAVCIPYPAQGHINPMLKFAKLLHNHGFHITFVLTDYNYNRLIRSIGSQAIRGLPDFNFESIPDGLPPSDDDSTQDISSLCESITIHCLPHFRRLLDDVNRRSPPVSCIVSDAVMTFTLEAARDLCIPEILFWTASACGLLCVAHFRHLIERGLVPFPDTADGGTGHLETNVDWAQGLTQGMRLRDFPSFIRTTNSQDIMLNFLIGETDRASMASAIILNTFEALEAPALAALRDIFPPIYTTGPLSHLVRQAISGDTSLAAISTSLWKEDTSCLDWLDGRQPGSVVYVNFGSITVMTNEQLVEFAWGLANSGHDFLWVIRSDLVKGETAVLPPDIARETRGRGLLTKWCPQEEVLSHPAVGVFLTHCGWNSTLESICGGVPMICWPYFAEQQTNCKYVCGDWGVGMEIEGDVRREEVESLIRETMVGEKGKEMRKKAMEWKKSAAMASGPNGSSTANFGRILTEILPKT